MKILMMIVASVIVGLTSLVTVSASSLNIINTAELKIDKEIIREDTNYNLPKKIVLVPIFSQSDSLDLTSEEIFRGIFFYTVDVLGFNDIPFHYIVSEDGKVFKGNSGGDERRIRINGIGDDMVVIGYIANKSASRFSKKSEPVLINLITQVANQNAINPDNIFVSGVKYIRDRSTLSVSIQKDDIFGNWQTNLNQIIKLVKEKYKPVTKSYKASVKSVEVPSGSIEAGTEISIKITVENLNSFGMYGGTDSEIILTKTDGTPSKYFLNGVWASVTQVPAMTEEDILLPFNESTFEFKANVPLFIGEISETFELRTPEGKKIDAPAFSIKVNVKKPDKPIIEIQNTPTGYLNVRETPSSVGREVTRVSPGQRFFVLDNAGNGWLQIDLGGGQKGWVASWLVTEI